MATDPANLAAPPIRRIEFLTACRFVFTQPEWFKSALLLAVLMFLPVLNQIVIYGYAYEITELLHRRPRDPYLPVDFRRFAGYATRGVWPFVVSLMVQTCLVPLVVVMLDGTMLGTMAVFGANRTAGAIFAAVVVPIVLVIFMLLMVLMAVGLKPIMLRAGLSQDFAQTFKFAWLRDFLRRMWLETFLVNLFLLLASLVLVPLGCAVLFYGALLAAALLTVVSGHLDWQLYELYLARGGEPIPLRPLPADIPPVAASLSPVPMPEPAADQPTSPKSSASP
ncbi:MAG: DUF4013 domain-containing protein [Pirellulaceae bacterium]|nr:DUF4013 domain-containing protein [Pirellulaceae bacterium]